MWKNPLLPLVALALAASLSAQQPEPNTGKVVGQLLDPLGDGVPAARVEILRGRESMAQETIATATTDAEGLFVIRRLPLGDTPLHVRALADDYTEGRQPLAFRGDQPIAHPVVRLWDAATIRIRVLDEGGEPIEGAAVTATHRCQHRIPDLRPIRVETNGDSPVLLRGVPLGSVHLAIRRPGFLPGDQRLELREDLDLEVRLVPRGKLRTSVSVEVLGLPPDAEALVRIVAVRNKALEELEQHLRQARTEGGRVSISDLSAGPLVIDVRVDGYRSDPERALRPAGGGDQTITVQLVPRPRLRVRGLILGPDARPLVDQTVAISRVDSDERWSAITDSKGLFEIESSLVRGDEVRLWLPGSDLAFEESRRIHPDLEEDYGPGPVYRFLMTSRISYEVGEIPVPGRMLALRAVRTETISGLALSDQGRPLRHQLIHLVEEHPSAQAALVFRNQMVASATTDLRGRFTFDGVVARDRSMQLVTGTSGLRETESFQLSEVVTAADHEFRFEAAGSIEGVLLDAKGLAIPGAKITIPGRWRFGDRRTLGSEPRTLTDRQGRFRIDDLPPDDYSLIVLRADNGRRASALHALIAEFDVDEDLLLESEVITVERDKSSRVELQVPE